MASITSANASLYLSIASVYPVPQAIQGFSADEMFAAEAVTIKETIMGVDGNLSAGFVNVETPLTIMLQADSASAAIFDAWYAAEVALQDVLWANGTLSIPSLSLAGTLVKGVLKTISPFAAARKVLQPRSFGVTFQNVIMAPI